MKRMQILSITLLLALGSACQNKETNEKMVKSEEKIPKAWEEMGNSPLEYPAEVYKGGLEKRDAVGNVLDYVGLNNGLFTGPWGASGSGMSGGRFVPTHINCIWLSYAENIFYKIDCAIDHDKMLKLFQEGYPDSMWFFNDGRRVKSYFNSILTGFAPGGVVVIWLAGGGRQVEIGRYKGTQYAVDPKEIAELEQEVHVLFEKEFIDGVMSDPNTMPLEVQKASRNKPIPYGLWDSFRARYSWKPVFEAQGEAIGNIVYFEMVNGEKEELFGFSLQENKFIQRAVPSLFSLGWSNKIGQKYGGDIKLDYQETLAAYKKMYDGDKEIDAELVFRVNLTNSFVTVLLRSGDKEIRLPKTEVTVFKVRE